MYPLTTEAEARKKIDQQLEAAGWSVQSLSELNLFASKGVAVREVQSQGGPADYMLFVDGKALGVVEAKRVGSTLSHVAEQSARYGEAKEFIPHLGVLLTRFWRPRIARGNSALRPKQQKPDENPKACFQAHSQVPPHDSHYMVWCMDALHGAGFNDARFWSLACFNISH